MGKSQRRKGVTGELEVAHIFQDLGFNARRGVGQWQSASTCPDVVLDDLHQYWIEVKRGAEVRPMEALEQASLACGKKIPVAFCRKDGGKFSVTMYLNDWLDLRLSLIGDPQTTPEIDGTTKVMIPVDLFLHYFVKKHEDKCKQTSIIPIRNTNPVVDSVVRSQVSQRVDEGIPINVAHQPTLFEATAKAKDG